MSLAHCPIAASQERAYEQSVPISSGRGFSFPARKARLILHFHQSYFALRSESEFFSA
jgi:hypothetical protein